MKDECWHNSRVEWVVLSEMEDGMMMIVICGNGQAVLHPSIYPGDAFGCIPSVGVIRGIAIDSWH